MISWVLLRGLTREAGHWGDFPAALAARLGPRESVLALDLPGNGWLHRQPSPLDVPAMAAACRLELSRRGLPPPYALVAISLGAMVALQWCHAAPTQVAGCVLINISQRGDDAFWRRLRPASYGSLLRLALPGRSAIERESIVLSLTSSAPQRHRQQPGLWADIAGQRPVTRLNAIRQLIAAARYAPPPQRPPVPMLVLGSAGDRLVSPCCSKRFAARWELPFALHPDAGHDLPLDDPHWVAHQIAGWWENQRLRNERVEI